MLIFINRASGNKFLVDNELGTVTHVTLGNLKGLVKYQKFFGSIDYLELPNLDTVNQFRKFIKTGILKDIPLSETRNFLLTSRPEYFI